MILTEHAVRLRIANPTSIAQPTDFVLERGRPSDQSRIFDPDVSPYCFDFEERKFYCVSTPDIAASNSACFRMSSGSAPASRASASAQLPVARSDSAREPRHECPSYGTSSIGAIRGVAWSPQR